MRDLEQLTREVFPNYKPTGDKKLDDAVWAKLKEQVKEMIEELDGSTARQIDRSP